MTEHIVTGCTGQKQYERFCQAENAAKYINRRDDGAHIAAYHCRHCNLFHVGENREYGKRRRAEVDE